MDYDKLLDLFKRRTSIRIYSERQVLESDIDRIIDASRLAPTSCNRQCWKVIIIHKGSDEFTYLSQINPGGANFIKTAPILLLIIVDLRTYNMPQEMNFPINDGSIVATYMMLTATALSLDTCWISWQTTNKKKEILFEKLKIEDYYYPICVLSLGYKGEPTKESMRENFEYFIKLRVGPNNP